jgi:hypothetical protein
VYVGVLNVGGFVGSARAFARFKISDLPSALPTVRLEWPYVKKSQPTGNVSLMQIEDFETLDPSDYGIAEVTTITATAITPATGTDTKLSIDVTTAYNQAKVDGRGTFAVKLQYATETEGVGLGRWYMVGATGKLAPQLVCLVTAGQDVKCQLLATAIDVDLARLDDLSTPSGVVTIGDSDVYPALGENVRLAATITGLVDDASGTYTGTPAAPIVQGPDIIKFLLQSLDEGSGIAPTQIDAPAFATARARLADWFPLKGGLTERRDVREWLPRISRGCRSFVYVNQLGEETIYTEPLGGSGQAPVRLVRPWEHGELRLGPLTSAVDAEFPVSRVEVSYAVDRLELAGFEGHALIAAGETDPADAAREAQAVDAVARYGARDAGGVGEAQADPYEWVPQDEPGVLTGVRLRDFLWDRARAQPRPVQVLEVDLPRFALGFRLMDEFQLESPHFPSAVARTLMTPTPWLGPLEPAPVAYQARRARCSVRAIPRLVPESGPDFPVRITAQIIAWETA